MFVKTPVVYKYRRLERLRGYRYNIKDFLQVIDQFDKPEHRAMCQANLTDVLVRKVFSLSLPELTEHLRRLEACGGFLRCEDFVYVMNYLRTLVASYEYYREWPFKTPEESMSYVVLVTFYAEEFTQKFHHDPNALTQATDFVKRSFTFWLDHMDRFQPAELIFLAKAAAQLSRKAELPDRSAFTAKLLPRIADMLTFENPKVLEALLDIHQAFKVLTPNQVDQVWEKLGTKGKPADRKFASAIQDPNASLDGNEVKDPPQTARKVKEKDAVPPN